jgi:hypothetical protein
MGFFERTAEHLRGRFRHLETEPMKSKLADREVTLYAAIKIEIGMGRDLSVLAFENHADLLAAIRSVYSTLDRVVSERVGAETESQTWSLRSDRTEDEILAVLAAADALQPEPFDPSLVPMRRPKSSRFIGPGKYRSAIANEACRVVALTGEAFGAVMAEALGHSHNDPTLLSALESRRSALARPGDPRIAAVDVGACFTVSAGKWFDPSRGVTVTDFCNAVSSDWTELSDDEIVSRLNEAAGRL